VDTEAPRYLNFEKWWGGLFKLDANEIHFITDTLFVGNELEKGLLQLQEGRPINLKNFKDPIFVFASSGDNITPPPAGPELDRQGIWIR
jgi:poly(3-hydroxyalkanoate) synthetase